MARRGVFNEYPQSMFLSRNKTINVHPFKPQFYRIKEGFMGSKLYRRVFVMDCSSHMIFTHYQNTTKNCCGLLLEDFFFILLQSIDSGKFFGKETHIK